MSVGFALTAPTVGATVSGGGGGEVLVDGVGFFEVGADVVGVVPGPAGGAGLVVVVFVAGAADVSVVAAAAVGGEVVPDGPATGGSTVTGLA